MALSRPKHESFPPPEEGAEIFLFKTKGEAGEVDPYDLSDGECVAFFIHRWNHPGFSSKPLGSIINVDVSNKDDSDAWQARLRDIVDNSPLFELYDDILEADAVTRLLDSLMRSSIPSRTEGMSEQRRAISNLMYMRASQIVEHHDKDIEPQLKRLPFGDEAMWVKLAERLAREI